MAIFPHNNVVLKNMGLRCAVDKVQKRTQPEQK